MKVEGIISEIRTRTVSNGGTVYTAVIDGTDVNLGFNCAYSEGEFVSVEVESTKWGLQVPSKRKGGGAAPAQQASPAPAPARAAKQMFPVDPNTKDHSIIRQNALTNANTAVGSAITAGVFKPKTPDDVYNEVLKVAYNLVGFGMGTLDNKILASDKKPSDD